MTKKPIKQSIKQITKYTISKTTHSVIVVNINLMKFTEKIVSNNVIGAIRKYIWTEYTLQTFKYPY